MNDITVVAQEHLRLCARPKASLGPALWLAILLLSSLSSLAVEAPNESKRLPAADAFTAWVQQQKPNGSTSAAAADAKSRSEGLQLVRARQVEMRALMETNPREF